MRTKTPKRDRGFTVLQLIITVTLAMIVCGFAVVGITSARAHIRRTNSARKFAALAERARADSVRRHAGAGQQATFQQIDETTYSVTMDFEGSGTINTQNFNTETGVTINIPGGSFSFDWKGRVATEINVGFRNQVIGIDYSNNVNISGSGDVTMDLEIFADGSIPNPALNGTGGSVVTDPNLWPAATPVPSPSASPSASATPIPDPDATPDPNASPTPVPDSSPSPSPVASVSPTPAASPSPTATVAPCSITTSTSTITIGQNSSGNVSVYLNSYSGNGTITATSSNSAQIQVSPSSATVSGSTPANFTISVKKNSGSITFSSPCGTQVVTVTVQ